MSADVPPDPALGPANGASTDDRDPRPDDAEQARGRAYRAEGITVYFDPRACWHTGDCLRGLPHVFDVGRKPWVRADLDTPERIAEQVRACPSGALSFELPRESE
ncbi:MAG: (4Fe-4S)-binding protein [Trueperaceae bacterium]